MSLMWNKVRGFIVLFLGLVAMLYYLNSKYVSYGECAAITYYIPLTILDRAIIIGIGIITSAVFFLLSLDQSATYNTCVITVYMLLSISIATFGNQILGSKEEHWPHTYKVQPWEGDPACVDYLSACSGFMQIEALQI